MEKLITFQCEMLCFSYSGMNETHCELIQKSHLCQIWIQLHIRISYNPKKKPVQTYGENEFNFDQVPCIVNHCISLEWLKTCCRSLGSEGEGGEKIEISNQVGSNTLNQIMMFFFLPICVLSCFCILFPVSLHCIYHRTFTVHICKHHSSACLVQLKFIC